MLKRSSDNRLNGGQVIVDYLIREKVPYAFGLCGHGNIQFIDALHERQSDIKTISVHHESVCGFMADAYYRALLTHTRWAETQWDSARGHYTATDFGFAVGFVLGLALDADALLGVEFAIENDYGAAQADLERAARLGEIVAGGVLA